MVLLQVSWKIINSFGDDSAILTFHRLVRIRQCAESVESGP